eukprot:COSAG04_NODE_2466_length_4076_cov_22.944933_2_plen_104_part_00
MRIPLRILAQLSPPAHRRAGCEGYSIRTEDWRLTAWLPWIGASLAGDWSRPNATELYDHKGDSGTGLGALDDYENENVASQNPAVVGELMRLLRQHFERGGGG